MNLRISNEVSAVSPLDDSLSNDTRENSTENQSYAFAEVVTLKYPHRYMADAITSHFTFTEFY